MKRDVDYTWRLAELMAAHGMHNSTDLIPRLAERGIQLSRPQVYRIVHQRPERVALQLLAALCDILGCGVEDLVTVTATDARKKRPPRAQLHHPTSSNSTSPSDPAEHESSPMTINPHRDPPPAVDHASLPAPSMQPMPPHGQQAAASAGPEISSATAASTPRCAPTASVPSVDTTASYPAAAPTRPGLPDLRRYPRRLHLRPCHRRRDLPPRPVRPLRPARRPPAKLLHHPADLTAMQTLIEVLCGVDRPESILTWKRNIKVLELLGGITSGAIPLTHDGLTAADPPAISITCAACCNTTDCSQNATNTWPASNSGWPTNSTRSTPPRFAPRSNSSRPGTICDGYAVNRNPGQSSDGPKRYAKQEITETIKFLTWLNRLISAPLATCAQQDVDEYLASGPTTRHMIRTSSSGRRKQAQRGGADRLISRRRPAASPKTNDWPGFKELLTGDSESLPYRVAGVLLLLYAQPLTKIAALPTSAIAITDRDADIWLGTEPSPYPSPSQTCSSPHRQPTQSAEPPAGCWRAPGCFPATGPAGTWPHKPSW